MSLTTLLLLYISFRIKQFTCDFLLQTDWMALSKGLPGIEGYKALFSHALCHALGTLVVVFIFAPGLWWLFIVDMAIHSILDRFKGRLTLKKGWGYKDQWFWWSFGLDQEAHNFTHLAYIVFIFVMSGGLVL